MENLRKYLTSKRLQVALVGVLVALVGERTGLTADQISNAVNVIMVTIAALAYREPK